MVTIKPIFLAVGMLAMSASCTFEAPGSVLDESAPPANEPPANEPPANEPPANEPPAAGVETLTVNFTTTPNTSDYGNANALATWLEDANGTFVKTLDRQSQVRTNNLVAWRQKSGVGDVDAVTGATRPTHTPVTINFDLQAAALPDGIYTIRMEDADGNSVTAEQNHQGTLTFEKNGVASDQADIQTVGYTDVRVIYSGRSE